MLPQIGGKGRDCQRDDPEQKVSKTQRTFSMLLENRSEPSSEVERGIHVRLPAVRVGPARGLGVLQVLTSTSLSDYHHDALTSLLLV